MLVNPSTSSTLDSLQPSLTSSFIRKNSLSLSTLILPVIPSMIFPSWTSRPFTKNMILFFANANLFGSQNFTPYNRTVSTPTHKMHRLHSASICNSFYFPSICLAPSSVPCEFCFHLPHPIICSDAINILHQ